MFAALKEKDAEFAAKQKQMADVFAQAGSEMDMAKVTLINGDNAAKVEQIRTWNEELDTLGIELDGLKALERASVASTTESGDGADEAIGDRRKRSVKSLGRQFVESDAYKLKTGSQGPESHMDIDVVNLLRPQATLMTTAAGWAPENIRTGRVVDDAQRPVQVTDLFPPDTTDQAAVVFMEETTFTSNAAEAAEGATYGEAALVLTERTATVRKIGVFLPMTDEQLADVPFAESYINRRLPFMIQQRLDRQLLLGNGTAPNLTGILNVSGIQTVAKVAADAIQDKIYEAMVKVRVAGRASPDAVIIHPNDWQVLRLLQTSGIYHWGPPSDTGTMRIWGIRVVEADVITEHTALVGDFMNYSSLVIRSGLDVQVSNSHGTFFTEGKQAVRADIRAANPTYRPAAFCTVTGLDS